MIRYKWASPITVGVFNYHWKTLFPIGSLQLIWGCSPEWVGPFSTSTSLEYRFPEQQRLIHLSTTFYEVKVVIFFPTASICSFCLVVNFPDLSLDLKVPCDWSVI